MNLDDLLRTIETQQPPPVASVSLIAFAQLQSQLLFMDRMVIENNLPIPAEMRAHLLKLHNDTARVWAKLNK
jgi:hypothetical protein